MPDRYTERGFADYAAPFYDSYGNIITIRESSAAMAPHVWIFNEGNCHLDETPTPHIGIPFGIAKGSLGTHLNVAQAKRVRDALTEFIDSVPERWTCTCGDPEYDGCAVHDTTEVQSADR